MFVDQLQEFLLYFHLTYIAEKALDPQSLSLLNAHHLRYFEKFSNNFDPQ